MDVDEKREVSSVTNIGSAKASLNMKKMYGKDNNNDSDPAGVFGAGEAQENALDETSVMVKAAKKKLEDADKTAKENLSCLLVFSERHFKGSVFAVRLGIRGGRLAAGFDKMLSRSSTANVGMVSCPVEMDLVFERKGCRCTLVNAIAGIVCAITAF